MADENNKADIDTSIDANVTDPQQEDNTSVQAEITTLRQQLCAKEEEAKNNYERFIRQSAELDNFKKRNAREREEATRFATETLIKDLLPIIDNLERAIAHAAGGRNGNPLVEGVEMVLKSCLDTLGKHGVRQIVAIGQTFDPTQHEAMAQVESDNQASNTVLEEYHKGYKLHDRLLRPTLVSVSKASKSQEKKNESGEVEKGQSDD